MSRNTALADTLSAGALIIVPRKGDDQNEVHSRLTPKTGLGGASWLPFGLALNRDFDFFLCVLGAGPLPTDRNKNQKLRWNSKLIFHKIENNPASNQYSK